MDNFEWTGRIDLEDGEAGYRWHQVIKPLAANDEAKGIVLAGFATDVGVARNKGRVGAEQGPNAIRTQLANLPYLLTHDIYDSGDITVEKNELEAAQTANGQKLAKLLHQGLFPIVMGGGHEIAFASYLGLTQHLASQSHIGIINFDAHLDLRLPAPKGSSGTPFYQAFEHAKQHRQALSYCCIGASDLANTPALFKRAKTLNARVILDTEVRRDIATVIQRIHQFIESVEVVYLTIDLDVLPAYQMPSVSAPASYGVELDHLEQMLIEVMKSGKVIMADLAELNPKYDIDKRGAKTAARIVECIARRVNSDRI